MSSITQLKKDKKRAHMKNNLKEVANICNLLGTEFQDVGDYDLALREHREEAVIFEALDDQIGVAIAHRRMGEVYSELMKWDEALEHQEKHLSLAVECENLVEQQRAYATIGRTHMQRSEASFMEENRDQQLNALKESEKAFLKALSTCDNIHDKLPSKELGQMRGRIYHNIGLALDMKEETADAISFVSQALELCNKYDLSEDAYRAYSELARMHLKLDKISKALEEARLSLKFGLKLQNKRFIVDAHCLIAQVHLSNDDFLAAKKSLYKAYKIKQPLKNVRDIVEKNLKCVVNLCMYRDEISKPETNKESRLKYLDKIGDACVSLYLYKQAIVFYEKRLDLALANKKENSFLAPIYTSLAQTYKDNKQFEKSLEYFRKELDIHLNSNHEESVVTLIEIAKVSEIMSDNYDKISKYFERAFTIAVEAKSPRLEGIVIRNHLGLSILPSGKRETLEAQLKELQDVDGTDIELEESEIENEEDEVDLDHVEFSDSDEELVTRKTRIGRSAASIKLRVNATGETPLHQAVIRGNMNMVKRLLEQNHPVNVRDNSGWLPIHEACNWGCLEIAELLIESGAWMNDRGGKECSGTTPLHDAASNGHFSVIKLLVEKGASVLTKNDRGNTPLDCLILFAEQNNCSGEELEQCIHMQEFLTEKIERAGCKVSKRLKTRLDQKQSKTKLSKDRSRKDSEDALPDITVEDSPIDFESIFDDEFESLSGECSMRAKESAAETYKNAIKNVGSHSRKLDISHQSPSTSKETNKMPLIPEEEYVTENWLIDDMETTKKRKRCDKFEFEYKEKSRRKSSPEIQLNVKKKTKQPKLTTLFKKSSSFNENHFGDIHFDSGSEFEEEVINNITHETNFSRQFRYNPEVSQSSPLRLHVKVLNKKLLVPVAYAAQSHSIGWLEEEVSRRYFQLAGVKLSLKLSTINEEVLNPDDTISSVLSSDNSELQASVMSIQDLPPLPDRYAQICQRLGLVPFSDVTSVLRDCDSSGELNFSRTYLRNEKDFQPIFTSIHHQNIQVLNLNSCCIEDTGMATLIQSLSSLSLHKFEAEACSLSSESIEIFAEFLKAEKSLKKLSYINLSYNDFSNSKFSHLKCLLSIPSLSVLKLASCGMFLTADVSSEKFASNVLSLDLDDNEISLSVFSMIVSSCPRLTRLSVHGCISSRKGSNGPTSSFDGPSLGTTLSTVLGSGSECFLKHLDISSCDVTNQDVDTIASYIYRCSSINSLNLGTNPRLSSSITKLLTEVSESPHIPLKALALHGIDALAADYTFSTCLAKVIEKKVASPHPLVSLSLPHSDTNETLSHLWHKIYKEKALTRTISKVMFLSLKVAS